PRRESARSESVTQELAGLGCCYETPVPGPSLLCWPTSEYNTVMTQTRSHGLRACPMSTDRSEYSIIVSMLNTFGCRVDRARHSQGAGQHAHLRRGDHSLPRDISGQARILRTQTGARQSAARSAHGT